MPCSVYLIMKIKYAGICLSTVKTMRSSLIALKEVLVPIETVSEVKNGKKKQRDRKFYPGYVFRRNEAFRWNRNALEGPLVQN